MDFEEPEILADFDRSYRDQRERLVLEKGEYRGSPTYCLRVLWQNPEGAWRWRACKPTSTGKTWTALHIKARELRELGLALTAEADELEREGRSAQQSTTPPSARESRTPTAREQAELDRFDAEWPSSIRRDDVPF
jgi:hypothetical protein